MIGRPLRNEQLCFVFLNTCIFILHVMYRKSLVFLSYRNFKYCGKFIFSKIQRIDSIGISGIEELRLLILRSWPIPHKCQHSLSNGNTIDNDHKSQDRYCFRFANLSFTKIGRQSIRKKKLNLMWIIVASVEYSGNVWSFCES